MNKISFSTKDYHVEESGIVRHKVTGEVLTQIGSPSIWSRINKFLNEWGSAASYATNGPWNHGR